MAKKGADLVARILSALSAARVHTIIGLAFDYLVEHHDEMVLDLRWLRAGIQDVDIQALLKKEDLIALGAPPQLAIEGMTPAEQTNAKVMRTHNIYRSLIFIKLGDKATEAKINASLDAGKDAMAAVPV